MSQDFYLKCAELLHVEYDCKPFPYHKRTRWNNRNPGSGRYPGYGTIRKFGSKIHVALRHPISHYHVYDSEDAVLDFLQSLDIP